MHPVVAVLTGGGDRPYALGLAACLIDQGIEFDFIGSDNLTSPELFASSRARFLNLRGNASPQASFVTKFTRIAKYYWRLLSYAATSEPTIFHILWNNKLEHFDRTVLLLYYRLLGKRLVHTVHNVNVRKRDGDDGLLNRVTLQIQYRIVHHIFVHTQGMKSELKADFGVPAKKVTVIPFGINSTVPDTAITGAEARAKLALADTDQTVLFFGNIAPYKGLEYLVEAMGLVTSSLPDARLIIAGRTKGSESYWAGIEGRIRELGLGPRVLARIEFVPDEETEVYFKAADVLVLPYVRVFQSGVLFLAYNFGLPVIASDVASLKDDIIEGITGCVCRPGDSASLAAALERYFASELYTTLPTRRPEIRRFAAERFSWETVGQMTRDVYEELNRTKWRQHQ